MNALLIDTVEYPPEWAEERVVAEWFGPLLGTLEGIVLSAVAASHPDCRARALAAEAVVITGSARDADSAEACVVELCGTLRELADRDVPVLGVCFGHQILARALGGRVGRNPGGWETGNAVVSLTEAGRSCPLFADFEMGETSVLQSHRDAVQTLPPGAVLLAGNAVTPVQAFRSRPGGRQFGVQFHPEFTPERLRSNWTVRREELRGTVGFDLDAALDNARPTPCTASFFRRFFALARRQV